MLQRARTTSGTAASSLKDACSAVRRSDPGEVGSKRAFAAPADPDMGEGSATKQPVRRRRIIERPRLTTLLDESQGRIKMLVAPAGYGKTTLARQWLEGKLSTWYTATSASTDVAARSGRCTNRATPSNGAT